MKLDVYTQKGNKAKTAVEVPDSIFAATVNEALLSQYIYVYLNNQRQNIAHTKDRSDVRGGGRKPWRQKGTGRARVGSNRSPIWTGGGVTWGPTNRRNWKRSFNKKAKQAAMRSAMSKATAGKTLKLIDKLDFADTKLTSQAKQMLEAFQNPRKVTIVTAEKNDNAVRAFANLPNVQVVRVGELNAYTVLTAGELWLEKAALDYISTWEK